MQVTVALGTRPEIVKLAPVVQALHTAGVATRVVHTGQHTDPQLARELEAECGLRIAAQWNLPTDQSARIGALLEGALREFATVPTDAAVVLGDTWTVPTVALAARSHHVPVVHVEAGLRSGNALSMEEMNRKTAAAIANLHLAPTHHAASVLAREGVDQRAIVVTGNPVTDALAATGIARVAVRDRAGVLFTAHRPTNVDSEAQLASLVAIIEDLAERVGPVTFPVHPRTAKQLHRFGLWSRCDSACTLIEPLGYRALLSLLSASRLVVTDSGGLQEEAAWFAVPTVVLRASTPRPEGVELGFATLVDVDRDRVRSVARAVTDHAAVERLQTLPCPYGDGQTAPRIAQAIASRIADGALQLRPPRLDTPIAA